MTKTELRKTSKNMTDAQIDAVFDRWVVEKCESETFMDIKKYIFLMFMLTLFP